MTVYAGSEFSLHRYVVDLLRLTANPGVIWFHPPNGEYRSPRTGARLKAMGVMPGVADFVIVGSGGLAYFLEIKAEKGRQSREQKAFANACLGAGAQYFVARSPEEARMFLHTFDLIREAA